VTYPKTCTINLINIIYSLQRFNRFIHASRIGFVVFIYISYIVSSIHDSLLLLLLLLPALSAIRLFLHTIIVLFLNHARYWHKKCVLILYYIQTRSGLIDAINKKNPYTYPGFRIQAHFLHVCRYILPILQYVYIIPT